jgi:AraC family transcriptional regulator
MMGLEDLKHSMDYIEESLDGDFRVEEAARLACCSVYHYQRLFSFVAGVPVAEYVRRRRLTMAAMELQSGQSRIIDLAVKYGYDSADAFSRAFQKQHGVTPTGARSSGVTLLAYPRLSFHLSLRGDKEMKFRIVRKDAYLVFGKGITVSNVEGLSYEQVPQYWLSCIKDGTLERISSLADKERTGNQLPCAVLYDYASDGSHKYMIGTECSLNGEVPSGFETVTVPAAIWAVFETTSVKAEDVSEDIQAIWKRVYTEWFPLSGYEHARTPELEVYYDREDEVFRSEVWIPVVNAGARA